MNIGAHLSLGIFPFAFRCVLSAQLAFQIYFGGALIESFKLLQGQEPGEPEFVESFEQDLDDALIMGW